MKYRTRIVRFNLTDRAKRYRAQHPAVRPPAPKQCGFCGSRQNVGVHHVSGDESEGSADNLMWACKSCNAKIAHLMKSEGIGARTVQFNPRGRSRSLDDYAAAIKIMRGEFEGDVSKALSVIRSTSPAQRSAYTARTWPTRRQIYGTSGRQSEIPF